MLMLASVFFIACEENEKEKTFLEKLDIEMAADIEDMKNAEGFKAIGVLDTLADPFSTTKGKTGSKVFSDISKYLVPFDYEKPSKSNSKGDSFDFDAHVGTYTWNNAYKKWDTQHGVPSDKIILIFPSDENNLDNNDATLTIHAFDETAILKQDDYGTYYYDYYPTLISADLYINDGSSNTKYVGLELSATWDDSENPLALDIEVFLTPFTFSGDLGRTNTSVTVNFNIDLNETLIFGIGASGTFEDASYENPITVSGHIQYREVRIDVTANVQSIEAIVDDLNSDNPTYTPETAVIAFNEAITAVITKNGDKVADIVLKLTDDNKPMIVLVYTNGNEEDAAKFFESFASHIEELFEVIGLQLEGTFGGK